jgi:hypothetical protein
MHLIHYRMGCMNGAISANRFNDSDASLCFREGNVVRFTSKATDKNTKTLRKQYDSDSLIYAVEGYWMKLYQLIDGVTHVASMSDDWEVVDYDLSTLDDQETILGLLGYG